LSSTAAVFKFALEDEDEGILNVFEDVADKFVLAEMVAEDEDPVIGEEADDAVETEGVVKVEDCEGTEVAFSIVLLKPSTAHDQPVPLLFVAEIDDDEVTVFVNADDDDVDLSLFRSKFSDSVSFS
jgi:hypothetical protein